VVSSGVILSGLLGIITCSTFSIYVVGDTHDLL
jgi:hypothetical protein